MVDLNALSLQQCLLKEKEEISSMLNLGAFLKTRLKKSLLTFTTTLGLLSAFGSVGCAEMPIDDFDFMFWHHDQPKIREYYVGKQKLSREGYYDYVNNAHLGSQCRCVPTHIQWQTYNNDLLHTCKLYLETLEDEWRFQRAQEHVLVLSTNFAVFGAVFVLIAWYSQRDEEKAALLHHYF